uniref:TBC1 domain family member 2B n=1 Tax=Schistocephalus solidus TaxID=70667 RepID=A0A0X3PWH0_SCHSO
MSLSYRIAGYLTPKSPCEKKSLAYPFLKRKVKREWIVLDEISLKVLAFADEESSVKPKREPLYSISMVNAVLKIESSEDNVFSITKNKTYAFQADSHASMLIWLTCLQSCRASKAVEITGEPEDAVSSSTDAGMEGRFLNLAGGGARNSSGEIHLIRSTSRDYVFTSAKTGLSKKRYPTDGSDNQLQLKPVNSVASIENDSSLSSSTNCSQPTSPSGIIKSIFSFNDDHQRESLPEPAKLDFQNFQTLELTEAYFREALARRMASSMDSASGSLCSPNPDANKSKERTNSDGSQNSLCDENLFLKAELLRLQAILNMESENVQRLQREKAKLEQEILDVEMGYTSLLQTCCTYKLDGSIDLDQSPELEINEKHKNRVCQLLEVARNYDPRLPTGNVLSGNQNHMDTFGFMHNFTDPDHALLYLCNRLSIFYTLRSSEETVRKLQWASLLDADFQQVPRVKLKKMCRMGIPSEMRARVWSKLIQLGLSKTTVSTGSRYYQTLVEKVNDIQVNSAHRRQITLDVLRTFPEHVAFNRPEATGVQQMQEVLQAFALHNPDVGYCQGMNFIVGNASLFLDKETTFWLLVLFVECHFSPNYFNAGLIAAQADQSVMRELIQYFSPDLYRHLQNLEIDMSTLTLNWFMAVFVSAVPIETLLRIWDVFLLEGIKVLFRVSLALVIRQKPILLRQNDTLALWKSMKSAVSLTYDADGLMKLAFESFKMLKRRELKSRRDENRRALEKRLEQNAILLDPHLHLPSFRISRTLRDSQVSSVPVPAQSRLLTVAPLDHTSEKFLVFIEEGEKCNIRVGSADDDKLYHIDVQFDSPILCAALLEKRHVLLGSADCYLYAFDSEQKIKNWEIKLCSSVTAIAVSSTGEYRHAFVGMANGALSFIENVSMTTQPRDHFMLFLGVLAVSSIAVVENHVWCACGSIVEVFDVSTLDHINQFNISENPLDTVLCLAPSRYGVWISKCGNTELQLWNTTDFEPTSFCDIKKHLSVGRKSESAEEEEDNHDRITAVLASDQHLFIGTGSGTVFIYKTLAWQSVRTYSSKRSFSLRRSTTISTMSLNSDLNNSDVEQIGSSPTQTNEDSGSADGTLSLSGTTSPKSRGRAPRNSLSHSASKQKSLNLLLASRCKVTESPVRAFIKLNTKKGVSVISFSEKATEDDAVLRWSLVSKGGDKWTNSPMLVMCPTNSAVVLPGYMRSSILHRQHTIPDTPMEDNL